MIAFNCFHCDEPLEVPQSMAGEKVECPNCHRMEDVPSPAKPQAAGDNLGTDENPIPIEVDFGVSEEDLAISQEDQWEAQHQEKGPRRLLINTIGEVIQTANNKSVQCPIREKRCVYTCAWFSIDSVERQAVCQSRIIIGEVEKNEYGKEDAKAASWAEPTKNF